MKNKHWLRLTGWLLILVMVLTVYPIATFADNETTELPSENLLHPVTELAERPAEVDITLNTVFAYSNAKGNSTAPESMDPNETNQMKLTVSGLDDHDEIDKDTVMAVTLPENITVTTELQGFNSDVVDAILDDGKLHLSWKSEKQDSLEATVAVLPHIPTDHDLSGSYALLTKTNVMVGSITWNDGGRDKLKSYKTKTVSGKILPEAEERSIWTLKHVSGDYYTVYSQTAEKYLKIVTPNHARLEAINEEEAQKVLVQSTSDGFYTFRFGGLGLNNTGNNAAKGFASYTAGNADNEKFKLIAPSDILYSDMIVFDVNGGNGTAPETLSGEPGTRVTLPDLNATKNGQNFLGWADVNNILSTVPGTNHTYHEVYLPGTSYTIKGGTSKLYAVYNSSNRNVQFGIRKDGVIVDEPNDNNVKDYIGHFTVNDILKEGHWVIDLNPTKPVNGYYIDNNVTAALNWVPSAEEIAAALKKEGNVEFNPETQYIHYYVLKYAGKWKIDGVIRDKASVEITYEVNAPAGVDKTKISKMPGGYQVAPGTDVLIGADKNSTEVKRPVLKGYFFMGWNTEKDGSGTYYDENSSVHLTSNLHLYAQWVSEADNPLQVRISSNWAKGKVGYVGARITLTATLTGFEGRLYTLQWQYSTDLENWVDVPGAHDITYTYTLDETTTHYTWRVVAQDIR